ncbi:hypothetical protein HanRHA438_Chr14g0661031 [Helianthus annuus]|nr:hypothetical protein HanIR_Chr14g0705381 [Helianthus annuus]KAJ0854294.1 hypothetical protein HanRHA438_Chr14g0661031 [Helianthus annuus]
MIFVVVTSTMFVCTPGLISKFLYLMCNFPLAHFPSCFTKYIGPSNYVRQYNIIRSI